MSPTVMAVSVSDETSENGVCQSGRSALEEKVALDHDWPSTSPLLELLWTENNLMLYMFGKSWWSKLVMGRSMFIWSSASPGSVFLLLVTFFFNYKITIEMSVCLYPILGYLGPPKICFVWWVGLLVRGNEATHH